MTIGLIHASLDYKNWDIKETLREYIEKNVSERSFKSAKRGIENLTFDNVNVSIRDRIFIKARGIVRRKDFLLLEDAWKLL